MSSTTASTFAILPSIPQCLLLSSIPPRISPSFPLFLPFSAIFWRVTMGKVTTLKDYGCSHQQMWKNRSSYINLDSVQTIHSGHKFPVNVDPLEIKIKSIKFILRSDFKAEEVQCMLLSAGWTFFMVNFSLWWTQITVALLNQIRVGPSSLWPPKTQQYWPVSVRPERWDEAEIEKEREHGLKANELRGMPAWDLLIEFDVKPFKSRYPVRQTED